MDAKYFQSWKFAFAVASAITILGTGYRIVSRHWPPHSDNVTFEQYFPDGQPSPELRQHSIALGIPPESLSFTLGELARLLQAGGGTLDWQAGNGRSIILKSTMPVPLKEENVEIAFQMSVVDPPELPSSLEFPSGAAVVTAMSFDQELADPDDVQAYLLTVQRAIDTAKGQKHFNP